MGSTSVHHGIAEVGEKIIRKALEDAGRMSGQDANLVFNTNAFYLGNWLTDVSQAIDPPAYNSVADKIGYGGVYITEEIERSIQRLERFLDEYLQQSSGVLEEDDSLLHEARRLGAKLERRAKETLANAASEYVKDLRPLVSEARTTIPRAVHILLKEGQAGKLGDAFKALFKFVGYTKFVLDDHGESTGMNYGCYKHIVDNRYTYYYPHEHLDRPFTNKPEEQKAATSFKSGRLNSGTGKVAFDKKRDLYEYLREDIQMRAGLIAQLDSGQENFPASWAQATFTKGIDRYSTIDHESKTVIAFIKDDDKHWNHDLARLGHALHGIEDYFFHSNFVEHANGSLPWKYRTFTRFTSSEHGATITKRLKKWRSQDAKKGELESIEDEISNWWTNYDRVPPEPHVATGYFDFRDTVTSLGHVVDHALGRPHHTVHQDLDDAIEQITEPFKRPKETYNKTHRFLVDALDFIATNADAQDKIWKEHDPSKPEFIDPRHKDYESKKNTAVLFLREKHKHEVQAIIYDRSVTPPPARLSKLINLSILTIKHYKLIPAEHEKDVISWYKTTVLNFGKSFEYERGKVKLWITLYDTLKFVVDFFANPLGFIKEKVTNELIGKVIEYYEVDIKNTIFWFVSARRIGSHSLMAKDGGSEALHKAANECAKTCHAYICQELTSPNIKHFDLTRKDLNIIQTRCTDWLTALEVLLQHPVASLADDDADVVKVSEIVSGYKSHVVLNYATETLSNLAIDHSTPLGGTSLTWQEIAEYNGMWEYLDNAYGGSVPLEIGTIVDIPNQSFKIEFEAVTSKDKAWWYRAILDGHEEGLKSLASFRPTLTHEECLEDIGKAVDLIDEKERAYVPKASDPEKSYTGIRETEAEIETKTVPRPYLPSRDDIRLLQSYLVGATPGLVCYGYDLGSSGLKGDGVDGHFGARTRKALIAFQTDHGNGLVPDGIYGNKTADAVEWELNGGAQ